LSTLPSLSGQFTARHWIKSKSPNAPAVIVDRSSKETLGRFGRPGRQVGMFTALHNIAVDRQGNIFTSEVNTGQRVQKFRRIDMQE
jgi:hypothetical protein